MPYPIPTRRDVVRQGQTYLRAELPELDPTTRRRSGIAGLLKSLLSALHDWYLALKDYADHEPFPQTARGRFLTQGWWADITKLSILPASAAVGRAAVGGTAGTTIPQNAELTLGGITFRTTAAASIVTQPLIAASLTYDAVAGRCVFETPADHDLATGMTVAISGAVPSAYNGTVEIVVTARNEFVYVPATVPGATPATGSPLLTGTWAALPLEATETGTRTNVDAGGRLTFVTVLPGVDSQAIVTFGGIQGGADTETHDSYRERVLEALGTDFGMFTPDEIRIVARSVPGVTKVWVRKPTLVPTAGYPLEGQVKVSFLRGNDANPIPGAEEVAEVRAELLARLCPAHTLEDDVMVVAPTPKAFSFTFTAITPNTVDMREAIRARLRQFFAEGVEWGETVPSLDYLCAIREVYDPVARQRLGSFALSGTPDLVVTPDEIATLGTVTFT